MELWLKDLIKNEAGLGRVYAWHRYGTRFHLATHMHTQ